MPHHFPPIQFLFAEQDSEERALSSAVAADKAHLGVVRDRRLGVLQQDLVAVTLVGIFDLKQHSHRRSLIAFLPLGNAWTFVMSTGHAAPAA